MFTTGLEDSIAKRYKILSYFGRRDVIKPKVFLLGRMLNSSKIL
jgi:hypothetical protein